MKSLHEYINEMAHAHIEKRTRPVMTPWGEYTGEEEEYEQYVVDKCDQQDWADFLRGKDELGKNLKNMKLYKIEKTTEYHYDFGDPASTWKTNKFDTLAIRWLENNYPDKDETWNEEMYAADGEDLKLAEELFKDIEAYRTDKMNKDEFIGKWILQYEDNKKDMPSLELNFTKAGSDEKIKIHMNAILG